MTKAEMRQVRSIYKKNTQRNQVLAVVKDREKQGYRIHSMMAIWKGVQRMFGGEDWKTKTPLASIARIVGETSKLKWVAEGIVGSGRARKLAVR